MVLGLHHGLHAPVRRGVRVVGAAASKSADVVVVAVDDVLIGLLAIINRLWGFDC